MGLLGRLFLSHLVFLTLYYVILYILIDMSGALVNFSRLVDACSLRLGLLVVAGRCRSLLVVADRCWSLLVVADRCRSLLVVAWLLLVVAGPRWSLLVVA